MAVKRAHKNLTQRFPIISAQIQRPALDTVVSELGKVLATGIPGDIVEFGCYIGTTSLFLRRMLDAYPEGAGRELHVYDSFEGLPPKSEHDNSTAGDAFRAGELRVSKKQLIAEFQRTHLPAPIIHKGWFGELTGDDVPDKIAFAFLDGDFYESIIDSLRLVWPRLSSGGVICIDDYQREKLPGVERAVRDFFQDKPVEVRVAHNIGIIRALGDESTVRRPYVQRF